MALRCKLRFNHAFVCYMVTVCGRRALLYEQRIGYCAVFEWSFARQETVLDCRRSYDRKCICYRDVRVDHTAQSTGPRDKRMDIWSGVSNDDVGWTFDRAHFLCDRRERLGRLERLEVYLSVIEFIFKIRNL